jgi:cell division protein FtsB
MNQSIAPATPWESLNCAEVKAADAAWGRRTVARVREMSRGGAFTIPLICLGVSLIACCLLIPAADENRRLAYERERLSRDLEQLQKQVATNDEFLKCIADDPTLLERLARRQLKMVRAGTTVMNLKGSAPDAADMSPFLLVTLPPPAAMPEYRPIGGTLSELCRHPKTQLYLMGGSLMMIACGLVLGPDRSR